MKSLILSTLDYRGGAAKAAYRVHNSLLKNSNNKINPYMFVQNKHKSSQNILCPKSLKRKLLWRTKSYIASKLMKLQKSENEGLHSPAFFPCSLHKFLNKSKFDIINLHWVQSEMLSIESIGKIKKPLVWTLHDYWAFSGSEHYPNNLLDKRYEEGYFKGNIINKSLIIKFNGI